MFSLGLLMRIVHEDTCEKRGGASSGGVDIVRCMSAFSQQASTPAKAVGLLLQCGFSSPTIAGVAPSVWTTTRRYPSFGSEAATIASSVLPLSALRGGDSLYRSPIPGAMSFLDEAVRQGLLREIGMRDLVIELKQRVLFHQTRSCSCWGG